MIADEIRLNRGPSAPAERGERFDWPLANEAEIFLRNHMEAFLARNSFAQRLAERMREESATDFFEWMDHLIIPSADEELLRNAGFVSDSQVEMAGGEVVYEHPFATLPRVLLRPNGGTSVIGLRPESVADFIGSNSLAREPEGEPFSRYRRVVVHREAGTQLEAVERRAYRGCVPAPLKPEQLRAVIKARE